MLLKELIFLDIDDKDSNGVLSTLVDHLVEFGKVKPEYKEKILEREKEYPTGIYTGEINIAIPHADYTLVNEQSIAIAVLKEPVKFQRMEDTESSIDVQIVFMLAIDQPHGHLEMLAKVSELIMNQEVLQRLVKCSTTEEVYSILQDKL